MKKSFNYNTDFIAIIGCLHFIGCGEFNEDTNCDYTIEKTLENRSIKSTQTTFGNDTLLALELVGGENNFYSIRHNRIQIDRPCTI